jgi:hypothetical protein
MSDIDIFGNGPEVPEEDLLPQIDEPVDYRPDLTEFGIEEVERGVCEDTAENRRVLRAAHFKWDAVYSQTGKPTGLIVARSKEQLAERRVISMVEKRPLLVEPTNNNSDFLTGLDLLVDEAACRITPAWVIGATKAYVAEKNNGGPPTAKRAPKGLPTRCRIVKDDGIRCMLWSSGRLKDDGLCRIHLKTQRKPGEDIERARKRLMQSAPYAVDVLEEMMESAISEPVRLKAATEILDRAGVRAGMDIDIGVELKDSRAPHEIIAERLERLRSGASIIQGQLAEIAAVEDAEVVDGTDQPPSSRSEIFTPQPEDQQDDEVVVESELISQEELDEL